MPRLTLFCRMYETTKPVEGVTLRATIPNMRDLVHFKRNPTTYELAESTGPEYYNDTISWHGYVIDYFNAVVELSNMAGVEYTFRTVGADDAGYDPFTGVVHDVHAGLTDVALSTYWITSDRLQLTPYSTPIAVDQVLLWVQQPNMDAGSLRDNIVKIFAPFNVELWAMLCALVLIVAFVNIWLSTTRGVRSYLSRRIHGHRWREASAVGKARIIAGILLDSIVIFSTFMFGHSVEISWESTRAQKILLFGFGFFILVAVASYTANLAAFLTVSGVTNYIGSMEDAIYTQTAVCIHPILRKELESVWPEAIFVVNNDNPTTAGMVEYYEAGKCSVLASSMMEIRNSVELMESFCSNELVSTGSLVLENPLAFPVNERYAGGLSYWLFRAEKQGITFDSFAEAGVPPLVCNLKLVAMNNDNELASLSPENFALPIMICVACVLLSMVLHLFNRPMGDASRLSAAKRISFGDGQFASRDPMDNEDSEAKSATAFRDKDVGARAKGSTGPLSSALDPVVDEESEEILVKIPNQGVSTQENEAGKSKTRHNSIGGIPTQDGAGMDTRIMEVLANQQLMLDLFQQAISSKQADRHSKEE